MKKLRFVFVAILILFLAVGNSNAQKNKITETGTIYFEDFLPCADDYVRGEESFVVTYWQSKTQIRWKGNYIGESGKHYTWSLVVNDNWKIFVPGKTFTRTYVSTSVIECEWVPIALYKVRFHITVNADGEIVVRKYSDSGADWICL